MLSPHIVSTSQLDHRSTESDSEVDGRGGGGASHGTAAELEAAQGGVERSRFSPGRIEEFKKLAADPRVYDKVPYPNDGRTSQKRISCGRAFGSMRFG